MDDYRLVTLVKGLRCISFRHQLWYHKYCPQFPFYVPLLWDGHLVLISDAPRALRFSPMIPPGIPIAISEILSGGRSRTVPALILYA